MTDTTPSAAGTDAWPRVRLLGLALLLALEGSALTARFSNESFLLQAGEAWWVQLVELSGHLMPALLVAALALFVFRGRPLWQKLHALGPTLARAPWIGPALAAHAAAVVAFFLLTRVVFEGRIWEGAAPGAWVSAWFGAGGLAIAAWLLAVFPPAALRALARAHGGDALLALLVGLGALLIGGVTASLWDPLGTPTMTAVHWQLQLLTEAVVYQPEEQLLGTPEFVVQIIAACSGYEGIGLIWVFLGAYLWIFRAQLRLPHALLLLPIGTVAMWTANTVRLTLLIAIGSWASADVAMAGFHTRAGWIFFCAVALALVAVSQRMAFFAERTAPAHRIADPTPAYLLPLMAIAGAGLLGGAVSAHPERLYPLQVVVVLGVLYAYRRRLEPLRAGGPWIAVAVGAACGGLWLWIGIPEAAVAETGLPPAIAALPAGLAIGWAVFRGIGAVVVAPLAEELAFRGYLLRRLVAADFQRVSLAEFRWLPFLATSALFGLLHREWLAGALVGMAYAWLAYRRGRLLDAILAHATTNGVLLAYAIATDRWSVWS